MIIYEYTEEESRELEEYYNNWLERAEKCRKEQYKPGEGPIVELMREYDARTAEIDRRACKRQFMELGDDYERILDDARKQTPLITRLLYDEAIKCKEAGITDLDHYLVETKSGYLLDFDKAIKEVELRLLEYHFEYFKGDLEATTALRAAIREAAEACDFINDKDKRIYRTRTREEKADAKTDMPKGLANITLKPYQYGISWHEEGSAYLQQLYSTDGLKFKNGKLYFDDARMREVSEVELQNMKTKEGIASIDLTFLRAIYSVILHRFIGNDYKLSKEVLSYNISDIAEYTGGQANLNKRDTENLIAKLQSYHNIIGVLHQGKNVPGVPSRYPVLIFAGYNNDTKEIRFHSPYMSYVIETVYKASVVKDRKGVAKKDNKGKLLTTAAYTFNEKGSLAKARNKTAAANVEIIVRLIAQCGDNEPHIKVRTLIERNELFSQRLASDKNPTKYLERVFVNTWEYLRKYTDLRDKYKNIQLPDPKNPKDIPSIKDFDRVFTFTHEGKISEK